MFSLLFLFIALFLFSFSLSLLHRFSLFIASFPRAIHSLVECGRRVLEGAQFCIDCKLKALNDMVGEMISELADAADVVVVAVVIIVKGTAAAAADVVRAVVALMPKKDSVVIRHELLQ